ncbi:MAG: hypothetical protein PHH20_01285 [Candidatus Omnitrophica bacterium]|nr:hypothetical protein [Candidatus Omnitrophota bacterium]
MKKAFILASIILMAAATASADQVSFVWNSGGDTIQGVDGDTSWWSNSDSMVNLNTYYLSLLGGTAEGVGYDGLSNGWLTQRGTRGLGISGSENDEIDSYDKVEKLVFTFDAPVYMNSFEVRSLYYESSLLTNGDHKERGVANFYLNSDSVFSQCLIGSENITAGGDGIAGYSYDPFLIDKIVFNVPANKWYTYQSEFSVAKLDVTTAPEPVSTVLFVLGGTVLLARRMRKAKR